MNKNVLHIISTFIIFTYGVLNAQFVSVKDGNWTDPLTWSTDPGATAIPDSNSTVFLSHYVTVSSTATVKSECFDLTIDTPGFLDNFSDETVSGSFYIKNDLINNGTIDPTYDFYLEVGGNLHNNGTITKHGISEEQHLYIMGNINNSGSFHFTHTSFSNMLMTPNTSEHSHVLKSLNDSSIFVGALQFEDSLGTIVIDSLAIISGSINLNKSKIVLPLESTYPNNLVFDNSIIYGGVVEANNNKISTKENTWTFLGNYFEETPDLVFTNVHMDGNFVSGGRAINYTGNSGVIFKGKCTFKGTLTDWHSDNDLYSGDRGIFIDGNFTSYANIYNATPDFGLYINQLENSTFRSFGALRNKGFHFSGICYFSTIDSLAAVEFTAADSNSTVNIIEGNVIFTKPVTIDFNGGILHLANQTKFFATDPMNNQMQNIDLRANYSQVRFASVNDAVEMRNVKLNGVYFSKNTMLTGDIEITPDGYAFPAMDSNPRVIVEGSLSNFGTIADHSSAGSLYLEITGDIINEGINWSTAETKLTGKSDQNIITLNDEPITGKVVLDAMISGITYQWCKNSIDIPLATSKNLEFPNGISIINYGLYQCVVDGDSSRKIFIANEIPKAFEISDIEIHNLDSTSTIITWKTDIPASGFLFYVENDPSSGYPNGVEDSPFKLEHSVTLNNLKYNSTYYFIIDQYDESWIKTVRSEEYSFVAGEVSPSALPASKYPNGYSLTQNYPNPFNPATRISFTLPKNEHVEIGLYNSNGQKVQTVFSGPKIAGVHELTINAENLSSGVYFYRIVAGSFQQARKMILIK